MNFSTIVKEIKSKLVLVVTVMAILDMMKNHQIRVLQARTFDDFVIEHREPGE